MKPFAYNLKALMYESDVTQQEVARACGVSQSAVSQWLKGTKVPSDHNLQKVCGAFQVTEQDLMSATDGLYSKVTGRACPDDGRKPRFEYAFVSLANEDDGRNHPVPSQIASRHPKAYYIEVLFDTMDKVIPPKCVALVDPDMAPHSGSVVAVNDTGRKLYRYLAGNDFVALVPESHADHRDIITKPGDVDMLGVVVWFQAAKELP